MSLFESMATLKNKLVGNLSVGFGDPRHRPVAIRKEFLDDQATIPRYTDLVLNPFPRVVSMPTKFVGFTISQGGSRSNPSLFQTNSIQVTERDLFIDQVQRVYSFEQLTDHVKYYIVDAELNDSGQVIGGTLTKILHIFEDGSISWKILVSPVPDQFEITPQPLEVIVV